MPLAKPSSGIEELVDKDSGKEIVATPVVVDRFEELKKKYEQFLMVEDGFIEKRKNNMKEVLLPCEINIFLQQTREYENHKNYGWSTGHFISQLVQNSYNAGNNNFELDMNSLKPINNIASHVTGTDERKVNIIIKGEAGDWCGYFARHFTFTIKKAGSECGYLAKQCTFTIEKAGSWCGCQAEHSTFTIEKAGSMYGSEAQHSTFNTHNPKQYERFKESVPQDTGNKIYLLSSDGSILKGGPW